MTDTGRAWTRGLTGAVAIGVIFLHANQGVCAETDSSPAAGNPSAGARWYPLCASCHGEHGEGLDVLQAPRLAGLPATYIARQLEHFRAGSRGSAPSDTYGQQMAPMAAFLSGDEAVLDVAAFIQGLPTAMPAVAPATTVLKKDALAYASCAACHGPDAGGSTATGAPPLAGQSLSYVRRQLANFGGEARGAEDDFARQMKAATAALGKETLEAAARYAVAPQKGSASRQD